MTFNNAKSNINNNNNLNIERVDSFDFSLCHGSNLYYDCYYGYWHK